MTKKFTKNYVLCLIVSILYGLIFYNAHYWTVDTPSQIKLRTYIFLFILVGILPVLISLITRETDLIDLVKMKWNCLIDKFHEIFIKENLFIVMICFLFSILFSWTSLKCVKHFFQNFGFNIIYPISIFTGTIVLAVLFKFRKSAFENIEKVFLLLSLIEGTFFCCIVPREVGISWDDEIHFKNVENLVDYFNGVSFKADDLLTQEYQKVATIHFAYDKETRNQRADLLNKSYQNKEIGSSYSENFGSTTIAYIPYAALIILGRGLHLKYTTTFGLARFGNMLFYILLAYSAIKKTKQGKVLMAFIALFPTVMYMAGSYSYDPWVVGFSLLGFSYFFNMITTFDGGIQTKDIIKMLLCFAVGFLVKAVYFPVLFPLLFIPKKKFRDKSQHIKYIMLVFLTAIFLAVSIVLPMIINTSTFAAGDSRGGTDVNSGEQLKFILHNPLTYVSILFNFFKSYLFPSNAGQYMQNYAYMSYVYTAPFMKITTILLFAVAFFDQNGKVKITKGIMFAEVFGAFCAVILVSSALYISFTPVGYNTVNGCQFRYLIPLIFPTLYVLGYGKLRNPINKNLFVIIPLLILVATFIFWTGGNVYAGYSHFHF